MRSLNIATLLLAPIVLLVALGTGLGYVRLKHGPIALDFLVEPIQRGINAELDGLTSRIDTAVLSLSSKGGLELQLTNVRLVGEDGNAVVSAPLAAVEMSLPALRALRLVPARVELIEPQLYLNYSATNGLTLSFAEPAEPPIGPVPVPIEAHRPPVDTPPVSAEASPVVAGEPAPREAGSPLRRIDLARVLAETTARARKGGHSAAYLRELGLRDATVFLSHGPHNGRWHVPAALVDLDHRKNRSIISGAARISSARGPWSVTFRTEDSEATQRVILKTSVRDLVPSTIKDALPLLGLLQPLNLPVGGDASLELSLSGELIAASLALELGKGTIDIPNVPNGHLGLDAGLVNLAYKADRRRLVISPSTLRWGDSHVTLAGHVSEATSEDGATGWRIEVRSTEGQFAASELGVPAVPIDAFRLGGSIDPERAELTLDNVALRAAEARVSLNGLVRSTGGTLSSRLEGKLGPMSLATAKAIWPRALAPGARAWVGERVTNAAVQGGSLMFESGDPAAGGASSDARLSFALEVEDLAFVPLPGMVPVLAPRALVRVENDELEIAVPDSTIAVATGRTLPVKGGRLTARDLHGDAPDAEITFKVQAPLSPAVELLSKEPLAVLASLPVDAVSIEGKLDGAFTLRLPLVADLRREAVRIQGRARVIDGKLRKALDGHDVQGATLDVDFTESAAEISGEMLIAGVPFKLNGQRILDAPADRQPPFRITGLLDNADRAQLGIDINHIVQGEVPIEVTVTHGQRPQPTVQLRADLTNAELLLDAVAWRKPPGRQAFLQFEIAEGKTHKRELQNFRIAGDNIAIEGWAALGADSRLREFYFPDFSLNVVTRLEVQGKLSNEDVWSIKARGPTFDGRDFYRALFSVGQITDKPLKPLKPREGVDLDAEIDNVIGFSDMSMRGMRMTMKRRGEKLVALEARGTLDGGSPLAVVLDPKQAGPRKLRADTTDAGRAFKMTGFYPNVQGGRARLEVNLDGRGAAEKTGTLWVEDFRILGDPVVSEVFGSVDDGKSASGKPQRQMVRQVFEFSHMRVPFSVGHGQFVMEDSYMKGPLLGAHIRGKVDYKTETVNLGGTYVPLQGLNNAFGSIPLLGDLLSGPRGEGLIGITFAIQGPMASPQAIVNPLSVVAPGIFREVFQMTSPDPTVRPREEEKKSAPAERRVRASSSSAATPAPDAPAKQPGTLDGWSSETQRPSQ